MREIIFDTETTGLDVKEGHRLVEFAGIELIDRVATGRHLHFYLNPGRSMPPEAEAVHGLSDAFLLDKPRFSEKVTELLDFLGDSVLVAHNAGFDMRFLRHELRLVGMKGLEINSVVDTLDLARKRFPGGKHTLDALCQKFGIDRSARTVHGALIDSELLAEVYIELTGGRQIGLELQVKAQAEAKAEKVDWPARRWPMSDADLAAHEAFVDAMKNPLWRRAS